MSVSLGCRVEALKSSRDGRPCMLADDAFKIRLGARDDAHRRRLACRGAQARCARRRFIEGAAAETRAGLLCFAAHHGPDAAATAANALFRLLMVEHWLRPDRWRAGRKR